MHKNTPIYIFFILLFFYFLIFMYLCNRFKAQMAESVDALVSNTSGATHPGSSPGLGTIKYLESVVNQVFTTLFVFTTSKKQQYTHNFTGFAIR